MDETLPSPARLLGPAGLIPFAGLAVATWIGWAWAGFALLAYGATILAFLGAVHWGLALRAPPYERGADWGRLGLGVMPALVAWVALLLPVRPGLVVLAVAILSVTAVETAATRAKLVPAEYLKLRWVLSAGAAASLLLGALAL